MSTITIDRMRLKEVLAKPLLKGNHSPDGEMCVMEAVAYVAGEKWSDHPRCASPLLTSFCIGWNDAMSDEDRQILKPYIKRLVNTRASSVVELRRSYMALDWYCRVSTPAWLRLAGLVKEAKAIEACSPIIDAKSARAAQAALDSARDAAWAAAGDAAGDAARDAAGAAAGAAAGDAAGDAAWAAARAAAGAAAGDAARAAARAAAWAAAGAAAGDAAGAAARAALRPTVVALQKSALKLLDRMIKCGSGVAA